MFISMRLKEKRARHKKKKCVRLKERKVMTAAAELAQEACIYHTLR